MKKIKLLVIGGTGFIGHHLLKEAKIKGWIVSSLSLREPIVSRKISDVKYFFNDLNHEINIKNIFSENFDYIVNLSGYINHISFFEGGDNVISEHFDNVRNIVKVINRDDLKCFINIGSSDEYGGSTSPQNENLREQCISPYSFGKTASTHFLEMLSRTESFPCCTLRLFLTYGPGQNDNRFIPQVIKGCIENKNFPTSLGEQLRDFCYVDDVVNAIIIALKSKIVLGNIYNLASGKPISIRHIIERIQLKIKSGKPEFGKLPYRNGENMELYADTTKIKNDLNWVPKISLEEGIEKTIRWYVNK